MRSDTAQEIFRLFNMSGKTEEQILAIMMASHYSHGACCLGIPFLKKESNILMIMEKTFYNPEVCAVGIKNVKLENKTDNQILALLEGVKEKDTQKCVKKLCIPYFKLKQKKEYEVLNLLKKTNWDYLIKKACLEALKVENKTDEQLIALMEITDYQEDICEICIKYLKKDQNIVNLMVRKGTPSFVQNLGAPRLKWENKTELQIMDIIAMTDYNHAACLAGVPFIKTKNNILSLIKFDNQEDVCTIGIANLKLSEKSEDKLLWIMKESEYDHYVCEKCLKLLSLNERNDKQLLSLMSEAKYNSAICEACIIHLKLESDVYETIKKTNFNTRVCLAGLSLIYIESNIINVLAGSCYDDYVCALGVSLLNSEHLIFDTMEKSNYSSSICDAAVKRLINLKY